MMGIYSQHTSLTFWTKQLRLRMMGWEHKLTMKSDEEPESETDNDSD